MSETTGASKAYPDKIWIGDEGEAYEVYECNNMFTYLASAVKVHDRAEAVANGVDPVTLPQKGTVDEIMENGWYIGKYFNDFINDPADFNQRAVSLARQQYQLRDALHGKHVEEAARAWADWQANVGQTNEFKVFQSEIFEKIAPALEADGLLPVELTI